MQSIRLPVAATLFASASIGPSSVFTDDAVAVTNPGFAVQPQAAEIATAVAPTTVADGGGTHLASGKPPLPHLRPDDVSVAGTDRAQSESQTAILRIVAWIAGST